MRLTKYLNNPMTNESETPTNKGKKDGTIKLIAHNVHMLSCKDVTKLNCLLHNTHHYQYDIALYTESTLNSWKRETWDIVSNTAKSIWQHCKIQMNSVPDKQSGMWQPGGVLTMFLGNTIGRVRDTGNDSFGRWTWSTLYGSNGIKITIINAYMLCQRCHINGVSTYYMQLHRQYMQWNLPHPKYIQNAGRI